MKLQPFRAYSFSGLLALVMISLSLAHASAGAPKGGGTQPPQSDGRIPIGSDVTPGDDNSVYRISSPGSYYLVSDISAENGKSGIEIASSHVTIDLNGHRLAGHAFGVNGICIQQGMDVENLTIRNGSVTGWGWYGINLYGLSSFGNAETVLIENVHVSRNLQSGIRSGTATTIRSCTAAFNGRNGIEVSGHSVVEGSVASGNTETGLSIGFGSARGCSANDNGSHGFTLTAGSLENCNALGNNRTGFYVGSGGVLRGCTARSNEGFGFHIERSGMVMDSAAYDNVGGGIELRQSSRAINNTILGLRGAGGSYAGILAVGQAARIEGNSVAHCNIGIRTTGSSGGIRIERNNTVDCDIGFKVETANNVIVANSARSSQKNFQIVAGNRVGTIVIPPSSGAIDGSAGGGSGSTDPWSNLAH